LTPSYKVYSLDFTIFMGNGLSPI